MEFIFWENILCHLQSSFIRELAGSSGVKVTLVVDQAMTDDRLAQGWSVPEFGETKIIISPDLEQVRNIIDQSAPEAIHVLNGYRCVPLLEVVLREMLTRNRRFGLLSEPGQLAGLKGFVGKAMYWTHCWRFWHRFDYILAMGLSGVNWFHGRGYPSAKLYPFAYVTESFPEMPFSETAGPTKIVFVGQCIRRKGLDLALRALGELRDLNWTLNVIGDGPLRVDLERLSEKCAIGERVSFLGTKPNEEVVEIIGSADLFILPSRSDGWGAVVNEALMRGVPVVCSDRCGAKDLVREEWRGQAFRAGSVPELRAALKARITHGVLQACERERIRQWSQCVQGRSVADYFLAIMRHVYLNEPRPETPWL